MTDMKRAFLLLPLFLAVVSLSAQQPVPLPIDSAVRYGHLPNGLTYYIRHNEEPKQRCDFHIAQSVGAVLEEDNQNGLAHFLEHMAFNGTQHFPGKGIINYFESIGVNFGGNINAYTSIDETVYRLSDVPTIREGIIDSALLVMRDWSCGLLLLGEEIDAERGVIREEWRTGANAQRRLWKKSRALMFPNSQYGKRDVIGDTAVINNFDYQALRDYYHKWYGPDNQAIIVVGDIDVDAIEAKIKALWADVPERANRGERPLYSVDDNDEPIVAIVTDKEAQQTRIQLYWKHPQTPIYMQCTNMSYLLDRCRNLIGQMLDTRFEEAAMKPDAPYVGAGAGYFELVKLRDAFTAIAVAKEGKETEAYAALLYELEKMRRYGFTESELEIAKANMLSEFEKAYNSRQTRKNIAYAREYIRHFEDNEPIPGIEFEYEFVQQMLPLISLDMINSIAQQQLMGDKNIIVCITGVDKEGVNIPSEQQAVEMLRAMPDLAIEAPVSEKIDRPLVAKLPKKGKIKKQSANASLGTTEWLLNNGIRVIFKTTDFRHDQILMEAFSPGGLSLVPTADLPSAALATSVVQMSGLGEFSYTDLQKALAGKQVSVSPSIDDCEESVSGSSTVRDLETLLQLTYLTFTQPRRDEQAYKTLIAMLQNQIKNKQKNPKAIFRDSLSLFSTNHSERTLIMDEQFISRVDLNKALAIYRQRFANPADFTFTFVGQIDPEDPATKQLILQWLGGLKTKSKREQFVDWKVRQPEGENKLYFHHPMTTRTATNRIEYALYDTPYDLSTRLNLQMVGRVLDTRYLESVREREGGSYGVGVGGGMRRIPVNEQYLIIQFDTDPDRQERIMEIIYEEIQTILRNGPLAKDVDKERKSMLKDHEEDLRDNSWWQSAIYRFCRDGENLVDNYVPAVEGITQESVRQALQTLVNANNRIELVMLPE